MKPRTPSVPIVLAIMTLSSGAAFADGDPVDSSLYYSIGGADLVNPPLNRGPSQRLIRLGGSLNLPSMCEIFEGRHLDLDTATSMVRTYIDRQLDGLQGQLVAFLQTQATGTVVSAIQKALPADYDWSQNINALLAVDVAQAKTSCQSVVDGNRGETSPNDPWISASTSYSWKTKLTDEWSTSSGDTDDVLSAQDDVTENARNEPIPWFGGLAGASDDEPIELVHDIASAGYAANLGSVYAGDDVPATGVTNERTYVDGAGTVVTETGLNTRLGELWPNSEGLANYAVEVLGEEVVAYCEDCTEGGIQPGYGLRPQYEKEVAQLNDAWGELMAEFSNPAGFRPTFADLRTVSAEISVITPAAFDDLISMGGQDRRVSISQFTSAAAYERTMEKAMALRQVIRAGMGTPEVQAYGIAQEKATVLVAKVREEMDEFEWETSKKNKTAVVAAALMQSQARARAGASGDYLGPAVSGANTRINNGRVFQQGGGGVEGQGDAAAAE